MKQLTQQLNSGRPFVLETPEPILGSGFVLVRNRYSLISPGTESATVSVARKNLLAKALARPKDVKAVLELFKRQGLVQTYRQVTKKLEAYSPMGYSCAGVVLEVAPDVTEFAEGDLVACAGVGYANHAEVVAAPKNLCVKLPRDANLKDAAYNTLGAIALQGVRQADLRLGESCAVIGLGLVGVLTCLLLRASGVHVYAFDVDPNAVKRLRELGFSNVWNGVDPSARASVVNQTSGEGVDATIVAASCSDNSVINDACLLTRKKGRVVVVGAVPTGFDRENAYQKELELRMSCSYGPGRYDLQYEELGVDYPYAYARWTEKRNMQAFQELVHSKRLDVSRLTTHVKSLEDAPQAYDMILNKTEPYLGILIEYNVDEPRRRFPYDNRLHNAQTTSNAVQRDARPSVGYAFVGAGSYAQGSLMPNLPRASEFAPIAVASRSGTSAQRAADKFKFRMATADVDSIFANDEIDAVFIATRHDSHATYALDALRAGKNVFVEKPLCLTLDELVELKEAYANVENAPQVPRLMVGYNRRFAPTAVALKQRMTSAPASIVYRVNCGAIPRESWIQDPKLGGGRILGEVCHFVDLIAWLTDSQPRSVYAAALDAQGGLNDVVSITLKTTNGSIGSIHYFANGSKFMPKERIEVFQSGQTFILDDFKSLQIFGANGRTVEKRATQDKGQAQTLRAFLDAVKTGAPSPIPVDSIFNTALATFAARESLVKDREIELI